LVILKSILESTRLLYEKTASVSQVELKNLEMQYYNLQGRIAAQEAKKVQEQMDYEIAREVLARYVLISPLNGMVTVIRRETGEWVRAGEMIVSAVDTSICHAEFNVEEKHARLLKKGKIVSLKVSEGNGLNSRKGTIFFVSSVADKASALIKVKVEFENMTGKVIPGVLAQLALD
jgi:multidrug efflux pump subunit AcrA (membrane-fusion protein)